MARKRVLIAFRATESTAKRLDKIAHEMALTRGAVARYLVLRQLRYLDFLGSRRRGPRDEDLLPYAREAIRKKPGASDAAVFEYVTHRGGRVFDREQVWRVVKKARESTSGTSSP